jgi:aspartyl-tRNA(Asn)/glutamyl-tRNA(Gln) amidotransferase subunit A
MTASPRNTASPTNVETAALVKDLASGATTATATLELCLDRLDARGDELGIMAYRDDDVARAAAAQSDVRRRSGHPLSPLDGVPIGIKDIIATADFPTRANSRAQDPHPYRGRDAPVVARLRAAGAVIVGKTATMEYAMGLADESSGFPFPRNPWNPEHWTGGSSSGSVAGVAVGMFSAGIGTDTAGSIRVPSAWCGVTGFKPTFGLVSAAGVIPLAESFDHVGPIARTAEDCALIMTAIADRAAPATFAAASVDDDPALAVVAGLRIGIDWSQFEGSIDGLHAAAEEVRATLLALGAREVAFSLPPNDVTHAVTMICLTSEALSLHATQLAERWELYGTDTRWSLASGLALTADEIASAERARHRIRARTIETFGDVDIVIVPASTMTAPRHGEIDYDELVSSFRTTFWNATGNPAVSIPAGFTAEGMPIGLQLVAAHGNDDLLLCVARAFQSVTAHHRRTVLSETSN